MVDHPSVQRRPVPVVRSVQLVALVGVEELNQTTIVAPRQRQRSFRELRVRPAREHSSQGLGAELQKDGEPFPFTDPTFRNLAVHRGYF